MEKQRVTRFSGAEWGDQLKEISIIGCGGIGSWTALNLARIGHELFIVDPDNVDGTNVTGGQMYRNEDVGKPKVTAVMEICREFGCVYAIYTLQEAFSEGVGLYPIVITGLDNMKARKEVFKEWLNALNNAVCEQGSTIDYLFIDGRLTMEMLEVFCIQGNNEEQIREYQEKHLFSDEEAHELDCTTKQSTFAAMGIASVITATLCNWLTNRKMGDDIRDVPFYQRICFPICNYNKQEVLNVIETMEE